MIDPVSMGTMGNGEPFKLSLEFRLMSLLEEVKWALLTMGSFLDLLKIPNPSLSP